MLQRAFDPSEPRDEQGQWTDGGGDGNSAESVSESGGGRYSSPSAKEFIDARDKSGRSEFLSPLKPDDLSDHTLLTNKDMSAGVAIDPHGDLQNLFNNGVAKGEAAHLVIAAIDRGARTLDCYDGFLPDYYRQFGFHETGRLKFDVNFAHGWDVDKYGQPDVVFMAWDNYDKDGAEGAIERATSRQNWLPNERSGNYATDFDAAKAESRAAARGTKSYRGFGEESGAISKRSGDHAGSGAGEGTGPNLEAEYLSTLIRRGLCLEDHPRRIYVRSHLLQAHHAISAMEADGLEIIPYDGPHIPGTELIDVGEWDERAQPNLKTLYVNRPLLNASEVVDWAKGQGFAKTITADDMHVTVAFSRITVDWDTLTENHSVLTISPGGPRSVERLGPNAEAVVLRFESEALRERWEQFIKAGASWDFDDYRPHVTISFDAPEINVEEIEPYDGELIFGPEVFAELKEDWKATVTEREFDESKHPRGQPENAGQFGSGGGGSEAETAPAAEAAPQQGVPNETFNPQEQHAIVDYIDNAKRINGFYRNPSGKDPAGKPWSAEAKKTLKGQIDTINAALKKSQLATDITLYRGFGVGTTASDLIAKGKSLVGKTLPLGGFQSTSQSKAAVKEFIGIDVTKKMNSVIMEISVKSGTPALDMQPFAKDEFKYEQEILLGHGSFKVDSVTSGKKTMTIRGSYTADE